MPCLRLIARARGIRQRFVSVEPSTRESFYGRCLRATCYCSLPRVLRPESVLSMVGKGQGASYYHYRWYFMSVARLGRTCMGWVDALRMSICEGFCPPSVPSPQEDTVRVLMRDPSIIVLVFFKMIKYRFTAAGRLSGGECAQQRIPSKRYKLSGLLVG